MLFTFMTFMVVVPVVGVAIDGSIVMWQKARLSASIDAAALAAGRSLSVQQKLGDLIDPATQTAYDYFNANFTPGQMNTAVKDDKPKVVIVEDSKHTRTVTIDATIYVPLTFLQILGFTSATVSAHGQASRRDVNIMLVLDRSGSMKPACRQLSNAAQLFTHAFVDGRDEVGLVTFQATADADDFRPSLHFQSATPNLSDVLGTLVCDGSTNSPMALSEANLGLQGMNRPGAQDIVVFFSDGKPDALAMKNLPKKKDTGSCKDSDRLDGIVESGDVATDTGITDGLYKTTGVTLSALATPPKVIDTPACGFYKNPGNFRNDIAYLPPFDAYGNSLIGHWGPLLFDQGQIRTDSPRNIVYGALNAADNVAQSMRQREVLIYTIGFGSGIDTEFMERLANDSRAVGFDRTKPAGLYVHASDGSQLASAFQQIASQILRIAQ